MNFKQLAARQALSYVEDGMILGLGSGSTTKIFIEMLGEKVKDGSLQDLTGVPTSKETARQARSLGIPLVSLAGLSPESPSPTLDLAVDGADRSTQHGDILGIGEYQPSIDGPVAGDDTVPRDPLFLHAEIDGLALGQFVDFHKTVRIEQQVQALASRQFTSLMMTFNGFGAAAHFSIIF